MTRLGFAREKHARVAKTWKPPGLTGRTGPLTLALAGLEATPDRNRRDREDSSEAGRGPDPRVRSSTGREPREGEAKAEVSRGFSRAMTWMPGRHLLRRVCLGECLQSREILSHGRENRPPVSGTPCGRWSIVPVSPKGETRSETKSEEAGNGISSGPLQAPKGVGSKGPVQTDSRVRPHQRRKPIGSRKRSGSEWLGDESQPRKRQVGLTRRRKAKGRRTSGPRVAPAASHLKRASRQTPSGVILRRGSGLRVRSAQGSENPERAEAPAEAPSGFLAFESARFWNPWVRSGS